MKAAKQTNCSLLTGSGTRPPVDDSKGNEVKGRTLTIAIVNYWLIVLKLCGMIATWNFTIRKYKSSVYNSVNRNILL